MNKKLNVYHIKMSDGKEKWEAADNMAGAEKAAVRHSTGGYPYISSCRFIGPVVIDVPDSIPSGEVQRIPAAGIKMPKSNDVAAIAKDHVDKLEPSQMNYATSRGDFLKGVTWCYNYMDVHFAKKKH